MDEHAVGFYDSLAENHHLVFKDWNSAIAWQAKVFGEIIERGQPAGPLRILDCACGIGTQALGLATRGHILTGTDLSSGAIDRARREAYQRGLTIRFQVADMRDLGAIEEFGFDAVLAADNALPHLHEDQDLRAAAESIFSKLRPGGVLVATIRDYDAVIRQRPTMQEPAFFNDDGRRRIVHQVWDWLDDRTYRFHLYITRESDDGWNCNHYVSTYRALLRNELGEVLSRVGFNDVRWLTPAESGFYQPVVVAHRPA